MKLNDLLKFIIFFLIFLLIVPSLLQSIKKQYQEMLKEKTQVGLMMMKGTLTTATIYVQNLTDFFKDSTIKAIVIRIESGGGAAGTAQTIFNEIKELKKRYPKPVIAFVENICASGAYYVACACDCIIASPSAFIGSIGVYIAHPELKEFIEQFKIKYNIIKTGSYKGIADPLLNDSPEQLALLQELTNDCYNQFVTDVAENRQKLSKANAAQWAEGKIFTGSQALALGLIDKIGSPSTIEQELRERTPIAEEIEWVKVSGISKFSQLFADADAESYADLIVQKLQHLNPVQAHA